MAKSARPVAKARLPEINLPALRPYAPDAAERGGEGGTATGGSGIVRAGLAPDGDHDGVGFHDLDLSGADGAGSTFLDCGIYRCALDEAALERARLLDTVLDGVWGVGTDLAGAELRDVELADARLGGTQLHGARLTRVLVRGGKVDFLNLRQARLTDVTFEGCVLIEPDFSGATLERVTFSGCALRRVDFGRATMKDVDLREAAELDIAAGLDRLSGAVISPAQLMDLAPAFAAQIGVRVEG